MITVSASISGDASALAPLEACTQTVVVQRVNKGNSYPQGIQVIVEYYNNSTFKRIVEMLFALTINTDGSIRPNYITDLYGTSTDAMRNLPKIYSVKVDTRKGVWGDV